VPAVRVVRCAALLISAVRWAGVSFIWTAPARSGLGAGGAGLAAAGTVCTPTASRVALASRAPAAVARRERPDPWGVLDLWEVLDPSDVLDFRLTRDSSCDGRDFTGRKQNRADTGVLPGMS